MKTLIRVYLIHLVALYGVAQVFSGSFSIGSGWQNYAVGAGILGLLNVLLKPILKLLFFPVNLLTLGLFSLVINAGVFYLFLHLFPAITLSAWTFPGLTVAGIHLPSQPLGFWGTLLVISFILSTITNFLAHLLK